MMLFLGKIFGGCLWFILMDEDEVVDCLCDLDFLVIEDVLLNEDIVVIEVWLLF